MSPGVLFESMGIEVTGFVKWGETAPSMSSGVYIVSLHDDLHDGQGLAQAPLDLAALATWLDRSPGLTVDGRRVCVETLRDHLARWWLPQTSVLYIGKASGQPLSDRLGQYYDTPLGARAPHGGGYWLKTLVVLPEMTVHFAETSPNGAGDAEDDLLGEFLTLRGSPPAAHPEPGLTLPWANLEIVRPPPRRRRQHGLPSLRNQMIPFE